MNDAGALPAPLSVAATAHIRGSSLLLVGRLLSRLGNFAVQVAIVRYLTMPDYGAFAYALSIVQIGQTIALFGLDRAIARFVSIYHEQGDHARMFGTIYMTGAVVLATGLALVAGLVVFNPGAAAAADNPSAPVLIVILALLIPLQALDEFLGGLFAVFAKARAIFIRRHVLAPLLKCAVVLLLIGLQQTVVFLAIGFVAATVIGIVWYAATLRRLMRAELPGSGAWRDTIVPWREVFAFTAPLLVSDLVVVAMTSATVFTLERHHGLSALAELRAQQPVAMLNQLVMASFTTLFTPLASRQFARGDRGALNTLYWQTAIWIAVLSFPIFVLTVGASEIVTSILFGDRYGGSGWLLAVLSLGYYFDAALGFNGLTLKIYGEVRYIAAISILTIAAGVTAALVLIPWFGAAGAAAAICGTTVLHNLLKQIGLARHTGIAFFNRQYLRGYLSIVAGAASMAAFTILARPSPVVAIAVAAMIALLVIRGNRELLDLDSAFPELRRQPALRFVLGI